MKSTSTTLRSLGLLLAIGTALFCGNPSQLWAQSQPPVAFVNGFKTAGNRTVGSATVDTAGTGYTSLPTIVFSAGNSTTRATGTTTLKVVGSVTVTAGGSGYSVGNVLTLVGGTGTAATFTVSTVSTGAVTGVTITSAGVYTVPVTTTGAATTGGAGTGCTLTVGYGVGSIVITNGGTGYHTTVPTITFSGGAGSSAAATAVFAAQAATTLQFNGILPLEDTVIAAFSPLSSGDYGSDSLLVGKTLYKGVWYPVAGNSLTLTSGYVLLSRRNKP